MTDYFFGIFAEFLPICQFKTLDLFKGRIRQVQQFLSGSLKQDFNFVVGNEFGNDAGPKGRVPDPVTLTKRFPGTFECCVQASVYAMPVFDGY